MLHNGFSLPQKVNNDTALIFRQRFHDHNSGRLGNTRIPFTGIDPRTVWLLQVRLLYHEANTRPPNFYLNALDVEKDFRRERQ